MYSLSLKTLCGKRGVSGEGRSHQPYSGSKEQLSHNFSMLTAARFIVARTAKVGTCHRVSVPNAMVSKYGLDRSAFSGAYVKPGWGIQPHTTQENKLVIQVQRSPQQQPDGKSTPRGVQFLSPRHITNLNGHQAKVLKITSDKPDNFGNPYVVFFLMDGVKYSKGFKPTSDALAQLVDLLGTDEKKWAGKALVISKSVDDDNGERLVYLPAR